MFQQIMGEPVLEALIDIHDKLVTHLVNYADEFEQKLKENNLLQKYQTAVLSVGKCQVHKIQYILKYCVQFRLKAGVDGPFQVLMELMRNYSSDDKNLASFVEYFEEKLVVPVYPVQQVTDDVNSIQQAANNFQQSLQGFKQNPVHQVADDTKSTVDHFNLNQPVTDVSIMREEKHDMRAIQHNVHHSNHPSRSVKKIAYSIQKTTGDLSSGQLPADPSQKIMEDNNPIEQVTGTSDPSHHFSPNSQFTEDSSAIHQAAGDLSIATDHYNSGQQFTEDSHLVQQATGDLSMSESSTGYINPSQHVAEDSNPVQQETGVSPNQHSSDPYPLVSKNTSVIQQVTSNFDAHQHTGHSNVNHHVTENSNPIQQVTDNSSAHQHTTSHFNLSQQVIDDSNPSEQAAEILSTNQPIVNQYDTNQHVTENANPIQQAMGDFCPGLHTPDHKQHADSVSQATTDLSAGHQVMSPNQESVFDEPNYNTNDTHGKQVFK